MEAVFLKFVDASNIFRSGEYIYDLIEEVSDEISEHRVVQQL